MNLADWDQRFRSGEHTFETPAPLVAKIVASLPPGDALDLACGAGRNALYLAERGWRVIAVDGSPVAVEMTRERAARRGLKIETRIADLDRREFSIEPESFDLICDSYYMQRDLFPMMQAGVRHGGIVISIVHLADADRPHGTERRAYPGELRKVFEGWKVLDYREGEPDESGHKYPVAEIAAQKPERTGSSGR